MCNKTNLIPTWDPNKEIIYLTNYKNPPNRLITLLSLFFLLHSHYCIRKKLLHHLISSKTTSRWILPKEISFEERRKMHNKMVFIRMTLTRLIPESLLEEKRKENPRPSAYVRPSLRIWTITMVISSEPLRPVI